MGLPQATVSIQMLSAFCTYVNHDGISRCHGCLYAFGMKKCSFISACTYVRPDCFFDPGTIAFDTTCRACIALRAALVVTAYFLNSSQTRRPHANTNRLRCKTGAGLVGTSSLRSLLLLEIDRSIVHITSRKAFVSRLHRQYKVAACMAVLDEL